MSRFHVEDARSLAVASIASLVIHETLVLLGLLVALRPTPTELFGSGGALPIDFVDAPAAAPATEVHEATLPPAPEQRIVRSAPSQPAVSKHPAPVVKTAPSTIDGVRIASADDVRRRRERGEQPKAAPRPEPARAPEPAPAASGQTEKPQTAATGAPARGGSPDGVARKADAEWDDDEDGRYSGMFRPDSPGFQGRIFGQVSVRSTAAPDSLYGRIHLFRESATLRDYSSRTLFGYSFQQRIGDVATRGFETGRVTTAGAYLMVTDLFDDGHLSTMSHTVIFAFPRRPPAGGDLYDVVEEPSGDFRLRGPSGSALVFDGRTGALRAHAGFVVEPPGDSGTPPRIGYRGLSLRLHATGSNPFLRDRSATVVDAAGRECELSTTDLFEYAGRRESDVFRFREDAEFFSFLRERCGDLVLPQPAPTLVARAPRKLPEKQAAPADGSRGLLPLLFKGFR